MNEKSRSRLLKVIGIFSIFIVWEIAALFVRTRFEEPNIVLPDIKYVFSNSFPRLAGFWGGGMEEEAGSMGSYSYAFLVILYHSGISILRLVGGTILGLILGIGCGLLMGWNRTVYKTFICPLELIRQIPLLALSAIFVYWFGGRELGAYLFIAYAVFVMIIINTLNAIRNVPPRYSQFARTLGATPSQVYKKVIIPAIIPELGGGMLVIAALAWHFTMASEYIAVQKGLGRIMIISEYFSLTGRMVVITLFYILYANIFNVLIKKSLYRLTKWAPTLGGSPR